MNSYFSFVLMFWALCIYETVISSDISGLVFSTFFHVKRKFRFSDTLFRLNGRGYFIPNLFIPVDLAFRCTELSLSIAPGGIVSAGGLDLLHYEQIKLIIADGRYLIINGKRWHCTESARDAEQLVSLLVKLRDSSESLRETILDDYFDKRLEAQRAAALLSEFIRKTALLRRLSSIFFLSMIAVVFSLSRSSMLVSYWPLLFGSYFTVLISIVLLYYFNDRHFRGKTACGRCSNMLLMVLFPPYLVKAAGLIGENLFHSFHPLALGRVFLKDKDFTEFACQYYRKIKYKNVAEGSKPSKEIIEWAGNHHADCLEKFFDTIGFDTEQLFSAPAAENDNMKSYCPRCRAQYNIYSGKCSDCRIALCPIVPSEHKHD